MRIAVVGAGPAGFYATQSLLKRFPDCTVDLIERLPVPFGLVRYGVAPDHPATKKVINTFSAFVNSNRSRINFYGNVAVGDDQPLKPSHLKDFYNLTIYATGAAHPRTLPGVHIPSRFVYGAQDFAFWANGHPDIHSTSAQGKLSERIERDVKGTENVAVIGVGNVAIDIARLLLRPVDDLRSTDISPSVLELLSESPIKSVSLFGRKSPSGAAWTTAALREVVTKIPGIITTCDHGLLRKDMEMSQLSRSKKSMLKVLSEKTVDLNSAELHHHEHQGSRILRLEFLKTPIAFSENVESVNLRLQCSQPAKDMVGEHLNPATKSCEVRDTIESVCGVVFLSLGYVGGQGSGYRVGWANGKGAGIIGDNKWDAETVISSLSIPDTMNAVGISHWLSSTGHRFVSWEGWECIDAVEKKRGSEYGRKDERVKLESVEEMLQVAERQAQNMNGFNQQFRTHCESRS
ncbi:NADPH:adrenodoxin oxidoreductase, mitochondrial [Gracilariopsis chorda]|uniref:NADPH:adrenodoxin oxidoreductase, mitochondrial n=1 Tax=Gracilariopsis chorda TaxID=448386 RepID=A0A2V3IK29_9FLOR|nr:NADPH:adrenodoxin oxidoreductase, mitochondrial [Gracilariopsis chorda]|eukprot:PXF42454.1 NADPH:adrenodoxin oxidoreductase, mitochondrial [Gracilariopsis chorda]